MAYRIVDRIEGAHVDQLLTLYRNEWWSKERKRDDVRKMLAHTDILFGLVDEADTLVGFTRVITDRVYRAIVYDVIVAPGKRGADLGRMLLDAVVAHPDLAGIESLELHCLPELEPFYAKWGFTHNTSGTSTLRRHRPQTTG
jgi:predicted GNAT family N-acyltransferase